MPILFTSGMTELVMCRIPKLTAHEAMTIGRRYGGGDAAACGLVDEAVDEEHVLLRRSTGPPDRSAGAHTQ